MAKQVDLEGELDRLYGDDPDGFVAGRDELVKRLRDEGRKDEAADVKRAKKPTRPAALVNWLSRERAKEIAELGKVAARMRDPKLGGDGTKLRAAATAEREAIEGLLEAAGEELERRGGPAPTLERVAETLRAMASDPEVEERVLARRLEREQEASTIGFAGMPVGGGSSKPARRKAAEGKPAKQEAPRKPKGPSPAALRKELKAAKEAAKDAELELEAAEGRVDDAEEELSDARAARKEARAAAREAAGELKKAQRRLDSGEK